MHIDTQYHKCNYNVQRTTNGNDNVNETQITITLWYGIGWYHFRIAVQAIDSFSSIIIKPSLFPNYEHIRIHTHTHTHAQTKIYC